MFARFQQWMHRNMPTRESLEANRVLRPVAHRVMAPALWRFTRRSVPRGVALGLLTGILVPMGQIPASALCALPLRANIPAAALTTFVTNPLTTPFLWAAAYWTGHRLMTVDAAVSGAQVAAHVQRSIGWLEWIYAEAGPALLIGLVVIAIAASILGYAASALGWRWWVVRKWRQRAKRGTAQTD